MSYCIACAEDGGTLWMPALHVGLVYVAEIWANAMALGLDAGLRFPTRESLENRLPPGESDEAYLSVAPFTGLVDSMLQNYVHTNHEVRRKQLLAVLPEALVLIERAGGSVVPIDGASGIYAEATAAAGRMVR